MTFDAEQLRQQIPYYLAADPAQRRLLEELKALINGASQNYFAARNQDIHIRETLQGDAWDGFQVLVFETGERRSIRGLVLSNSCDIAPDNKRAIPPNVTFAPIARLSKIADRFHSAGLDRGQVNSKIEAIRAQTITNLFYLPNTDPLDDEYVALLDDLHSMPAKLHQESSTKIFTLSMAGFYLFVFKLSVHFCRLHENVMRT